MRLKPLTIIVLTVLLIGMLALALSIDGGYVLADGTWLIETVDSGSVGGYTSIALDSYNNPHISHFDHGPFRLRYAYEAPPPPPEGVGGIKFPVDKFGLLAPYIGVASAIIAATTATAIYVKRVKRREEK